MDERLNIRYVKLHFTLEIMENTELPVTKASAIRGGIGEMLLRANCIRDRKCEECDFETECLVQRMMSSDMKIMPTFMSKGDSVGYVLECEDYRKNFDEGDELKFNLILFGSNIVYFSQYINAVYALGRSGLGKNASKFVIAAVKNSKGQDILCGNDVDLRRYEVMYLKDYVEYRLREFGDHTGNIRLKLQSPTALKYQKELLRELDIIPVMEAVARRIYIMDCFEGIESEMQDISQIGIPKVLEKSDRKMRVSRYSNRKDMKMNFEGLEGEMLLDGCNEDVLRILLAGEILHIGKNTSFGFGRYRLFRAGNNS